MIKIIMAEGWDSRALPLLPYLEAWQPALVEIRKGAAVGNAQGIGYGEGMITPVPNFLIQQNAAKMLAVYGRYLESQGRWGDALEQYNTVLKMGRDYTGPDQFLISHLIGIAQEHISLRQMNRLVGTGSLSASQLLSTMNLLSEIDQSNGTTRRAYDGEMTAQRVMMQQIRDDPEQYKLSNEQEDVAKQLAGFLSDYDRVIAEQSYLWGLWADYLETPYSKRNAESLNDIEAVLLKMHPLSGIAQPNIMEADVRTLSFISRIRQTQLAAALEQWRLEKNGLPDSLQTLVSAGYMERLPVDPFSGNGFEFERYSDSKYKIRGSGPMLSGSSTAPAYDPTNGTVSSGWIQF